MIIHLLSVAILIAVYLSCSSHFDSILEAHDVYKVETIGDCYMAVTGLFDRHGDQGNLDSCRHSCRLSSQRKVMRRDGGWGKLGGRDVLHAIKALRFAQAISQMASNVPCPLGSGSIQMRIGLHSGPVYSGVVGRKMPRFCLFGDTVSILKPIISPCMHQSLVCSGQHRLANGEHG